MSRKIGELKVFRYQHEDRNRWHIEQADPLVRITAEWLRDMEQGASLWRDDLPAWLNPPVRIVDDVVTIYGHNRTVAYRRLDDSYDAETDTYLMEWPTDACTS